MITPSPNFVSTDLGRLHVRRTGTGPPVVSVVQPLCRFTVVGSARRTSWPETAR